MATKIGRSKESMRRFATGTGLAARTQTARKAWAGRQKDALKLLVVDVDEIAKAIGDISLAEASGALKKAAIEYLDRAR